MDVAQVPRMIRLPSGSIQELWNSIREACSQSEQPTTIDLEGGTFSGRVSGLSISVCEGTKAMYDKAFTLAPRCPLTIQNGQIDLGRYSLVVSGGACRFSNVQISGQGQAWRRRALACLVHVSGAGTTLQLDGGSSLHCVAEEPVHTMVMNQGACVTMHSSKISHSNHALGIKIIGGVLEAEDCEFSGLHESIAVLTPAPTGSAPPPPSPQGDPSSCSMVKLERCTLAGVHAGSIGTVCTIVGPRSSLSAARCQFGNAAVGLVATRGGWLILEESTISDATFAGVWCSGGHAQATDCQFLSHMQQQPAVRIERKGSIEMRRCSFLAPAVAPGTEAVGLLIDGAGAFARSIDCRYEGYGMSAIVESAGGSFLAEEGVEDAIRLS